MKRQKYFQVLAMYTVMKCSCPYKCQQSSQGHIHSVTVSVTRDFQYEFIPYGQRFPFSTCSQKRIELRHQLIINNEQTYVY
jgi:hypothetical protein